MKKTERIIAALLGVISLGILAFGLWLLSVHPESVSSTFTKSPFKSDGVFFGTGLFNFFIIAAALLGLSLNRLSSSAFLFIMLLCIVWSLVIEPFLKVKSVTPYCLREWLVDVFIYLLLLSPVIINYMRKRLSNNPAHPSSQGSQGDR